MGIFVLAANAEDNCVFLFELPEVALKIVRFFGAAAGEILGIKIEHDPLAAEIVQAERLAFLRIHGEVWRGRPRDGRFLA